MSCYLGEFRKDETWLLRPEIWIGGELGNDWYFLFFYLSSCRFAWMSDSAAFVDDTKLLFIIYGLSYNCLLELFLFYKTSTLPLLAFNVDCGII